MTGSEAITAFAGEHSFLSNFHPSRVQWMGFEVATVEHAFQMAKTLGYEDRSPSLGRHLRPRRR